MKMQDEPIEEIFKVSNEKSTKELIKELIEESDEELDELKMVQLKGLKKYF